MRGFVLVTSNRKSMPGHLADHLAAGRHLPGIFELPPWLSIGDAIDELALIAELSDGGEYRDQIVFLPV